MNIVFLASGKGSTFQYFLENLPMNSCQVTGLVTDRKDAFVHGVADQFRVPYKAVNYKGSESYEAWDREIAAAVESFSPDLILLAGFLRKLGPCFLERFAGMTLNSHPSLLPKYGGGGMYGRKVHEAVIQHKEALTGVTIHRVNGEYDSGAIVGQLEIPVSVEDTAESLEVKVKEQEKLFYFTTVIHVIEGKTKLT